MLRTAAQQKTLCKDCPVARAANMLGDSCTLLIVRDLLEKPRRFGELQESLKGISSRTLTNKLKDLEDRGIVTRKNFKVHPPRVLYVLTKKGKGLAPIERALRTYGKKYLTRA
jgi:DNA-binding HxlR family transcriptional regulator